MFNNVQNPYSEAVAVILEKAHVAFNRITFLRNQCFDLMNFRHVVGFKALLKVLKNERHGFTFKMRI